ncbi:MAG: endonuclease/exonuclease/phosphatase family protein [Clostridia bacterium]
MFTKYKRKVMLIASISLVAVMLGLMLTACTGGHDFVLEERNTDELVVLSYNIRSRQPFTHKQDRWNYRKEALVEHIYNYSPDIIGMQEVKGVQLTYLERHLHGYAYVGRSRNKTEKAGEGVYIFYREDRLEVVESEIFWLSETPEKSSKGWDGSHKRIAVYALFKDKKTGELFVHYNTHLDHKGEEARAKGMGLILNKILNSEYPVIFTGDFNFEESDPNYTIVAALLDDIKYTATVTMAGTTYNAYGKEPDRDDAIDFCFVSPFLFDALEYRILDEKVNDRYTSDHYAVLARLKITT